MRYVMKQNIWSFGSGYVIKDAHGRDVLWVEGKFFSWGNQLIMRDSRGQQHAYIKQKIVSFKPTYEIYRGGQKFAEIVKEWSWLKKEFTLDVPGPNDYLIQGSFWNHEYRFDRLGRTIATVSKSYFSWADTYGVDIWDREDHVSVLAACVVIDLVCHDEEGGSGIKFTWGSS